MKTVLTWYDVAQVAGGDQVADPLDVVVEAVDDADGEHAAAAASLGLHGLGLADIQGDGLFAQDVLARAEAGDRDRCVQVVGQADADGVDGGILRGSRGSW